MSKKTTIVSRYVEVFNEDHAVRIADCLNSTYRKEMSSSQSRFFSPEIHSTFMVKVPSGKWAMAKTFTKDIVGRNTPLCRTFRFICFTKDHKPIITTS